VPSNVLMQKYGARTWLTRIMGTWGIVAAAMAFVWNDTSFYVRASVSVSRSESWRAPYFPTDGALQAQAEALTPVNGVDPFYAGGNNGRSYGRSFAAAAEHRLTPNVYIGARLAIERSTNYTPSRLLLYVRMTPGVSSRPPSMPPEPVVLPGFQY